MMLSVMNFVGYDYRKQSTRVLEDVQEDLGEETDS